MKTILKNIAENIKASAIEKAYEEAFQDGNIEINFIHHYNTEIEIYVKALLDVSDYIFNCETHEHPCEVDYKVKFLNAKIETLYNENSIEMINVTNFINQKLS